MANTVGPLCSLEASGQIGGTLDYKCGSQVAVSKRSDPSRGNALFNAQQAVFKAGVAVWNSLGDETKIAWFNYGWWILGKQGPHDQDHYITGYQAFMSYYLKEGPNGWENYPGPPN